MEIKNILIVDDASELSQLLSESLTPYGFSTYFFITPRAAIKYVLTNYQNIDLIISDFHMPELTGLQMMREIHHIKKIPYILLSGRICDIKDDYSVMELERVNKPFRIKHIVSLIHLIKYQDFKKEA